MNSVQWFRATYPRVLAFHTPNGEKRDRRTAEKLKRMGVLPGVADWLIFRDDGQKMAIEFKTPEEGSKASADQERFETGWCRTGGFYHIVVSVDEFKAMVGDFLRPTVPWLRDSNPTPANLAV